MSVEIVFGNDFDFVLNAFLYQKIVSFRVLFLNVPIDMMGYKHLIVRCNTFQWL